MTELAVFIALLGAANGVLIVGVLTAYVLVSRRRARIFFLVDHLAALARKGLPLHTGLRALAQDLKGIMGTRLEAVARLVEEGTSLGDAMAAAPRTFPPLLRSMVALGEKSGNFASFLEQLRRSYRRATELSYQSVYPFFYPLLLSVLVNLAVTGASLVIAPKFSEILVQARLPDPYTEWWPVHILACRMLLIMCLLVLLFVTLGGFSAHFGSSMLRFLKGVTDRSLLAVPLLGAVLRDGAAHHFALCTGLFLRAGASVPDAVAAVAEAERNEVYRRRLRVVAEQVREGVSLSDAVRPVFRSDLLWFVETGEAAGSLPEHLIEASILYDTRVRFSAELARRSVVPTFVLLNGALVLVGFMLIVLPFMQILKFSIPE